MFESERLIYFLDTKLKHILWVRYSKDSSPTTQIQNKGIKYIMTEYPGDTRPEFKMWGGASKSVFVSVNINLLARL